MGKAKTREDTRWLVRSISLPVQACESHPWPEFMHLLHSAWRQSTDLANWASHTLSALDVVRLPGMASLPPMAPADLYALAFGRDREKHGRDGEKVLPAVAARYGREGWGGAMLSAATLLRKVAAKYARERGKVVWRRERRTPEYLYPHPFPVHKQSWAPSFGDRGQPMLSAALPGGRLTVRLRGGDQFRRQLRILRSIADGEADQQELTLCRQRAGTGGVANHLSEQRPAGGHRVSYRVMARVSHRFEVAARDTGVVASVRTGADPFLTVVIGDREPWVLHPQQVRNFVVAHRAFLDRMADDLKYEKRWPRKKRKRMLHRLSRGCDKHARRMKSFRQEYAAMVAGFAARNGCDAVRFDGSDRGFLTRDFPWYEFEEDLQNKCDELGLAFDATASGGEVEVPDVPEADANTNGATA